MPELAYSATRHRRGLAEASDATLLAAFATATRPPSTS